MMRQVRAAAPVPIRVVGLAHYDRGMDRSIAHGSIARTAAFGCALALIFALAGCGFSNVEPPAQITKPAKADCTPAKTLPVGDSNHTIDFGGQKRRFRIHVPPDYDGTQKTPVVYAFHGLGGNANVAIAYTGWDEKADDENFIVVAPQGLGPVPHWDFVTPASEKSSDLAFVKELTNTVNSAGCIDQDRTYATGFSNGSAMTFAFACSGGFNFAAYGGVSAAIYWPQCEQNPAASIIYFHGTKDPIVPFRGGQSPIGDMDPVSLTMARWSAHDGCNVEADAKRVTDKVNKYLWRNCVSGVDLQAYVVKGGGHTWPGAQQVAVLRKLGFTTDDVNATELIWRFFAEHPKRGQ